MGMVSCLAKPQCGQVSTDSRMTALIFASLLHRGRIARVLRGFGRSLRLGVVGVMLATERHTTAQ